MINPTSLQRSRIDFHLDLDSSVGFLALAQNIREATFTQDKWLAILGDIEVAAPADILSFQGLPLCTRTSALGRCELALANLSPEVIDNSLFVSQAGKVSLRKDELKARKQLYREVVSQLRQECGLPQETPGGGRASWCF